jgi:transcriptional regulator with XRE-family HTH domain
MLLGDWFKMRRQFIGLSQDEMAERLGITPASYRNWERGRTDPQVPLWKIGDVASAFEVTVTDLAYSAKVGRSEAQP